VKTLAVRALAQISVLLVFSQAPAAAQDGLQLLHKMQTASGGRERIAAIHDYEESVQAQTWNNEGKLNGEVRKRTRWITPNYLRLDQVGPDDSYVLYFDGKSGWEILPDKNGILPLVGDELKFAEKYLFGLRVKLWLADRDSRYMVESSTINVIRISDKYNEANRLDITLDRVSWLPTKQTDGATETRLEQWSAVQGIQFPQRISMIRDGATVVVIRVNKIELDRGLKVDELGEKPQDSKPVMTHGITDTSGQPNF
jgi:hypothetical protein